MRVRFLDDAWKVAASAGRLEIWRGATSPLAYQGLTIDLQRRLRLSAATSTWARRTVREAKLPEFLRPAAAGELIRMGRPNDGGYVVEVSSITDADGLISLGVNDDWSFDEAFVARKDVPVHAFDPTVGRKVFAKRALKSLARPLRPGHVAYNFRVFNGYNNFFTGQRVHHEKFVGPATVENVISLRDIFNEILDPSARRVFLKMDIEGAEYRIFDQILEVSDRLSGFVAEFHDVDLHLDRIEAFVKALPMRLCHTHCNNYGPIAESGVPTVIECSFTQGGPEGPMTWALPHALDMPCRPDRADYRISFS